MSRGGEPNSSPADGRAAAALAVADALAGRRFVTETLRAARAGGELAGREAGLAMEVGQGTLRHLLTIEHVLGTLARYDLRRTPPRLRAILCTAAYQIIWMDRIPPFAAVDQAVELARRLVRGRAPAMVNAVLRKMTGALAERGTSWTRLEPTLLRTSWDRACRFNLAVLPATNTANELTDHLAMATGERPERLARLVSLLGAEAAEAVAWASQAVPPTVLQRNAIRVERETFQRGLRDALGEQVEIAADAAFVSPSSSVIGSPPFVEGLAFVQDTTASAAVRAVAAESGESVLDLCAAPGGKSVALAMAMNDAGRVVACDSNAARLARVGENAERLGIRCIETRVLSKRDADPAEARPDFDAALVDVPCSNSGVIARRPEARLGLTASKLGSLLAVQGQLLRLAAGHVRPGGRLVYSTCSIEPQENEQIVAAFLAERPGWRLDAQELTLPAWGPRWSDWRDGGFWARMIRED